MNLSFGCYTDDGEPPLVLARAVSLVSAEILLVAAAGNHGNIDELKKQGDLKDASWARGLTPKTPVWPAAFDEVIAVGATDAPFSPQTPWVDLTAPGMNVVSTYLTGQVKLGSPRRTSDGGVQRRVCLLGRDVVCGCGGKRCRGGQDPARSV